MNIAPASDGSTPVSNKENKPAKLSIPKRSGVNMPAFPAQAENSSTRSLGKKTNPIPDSSTSKYLKSIKQTFAEVHGETAGEDRAALSFKLREEEIKRINAEKPNQPPKGFKK